jgi:hypothetical protein
MKQSRNLKYVRVRIEILDKILEWARKYIFVDLNEKLNGSLDLTGYPKIYRKTLFRDLNIEKIFINYELKSLIIRNGSGMIVKKQFSIKQELFKEIDSITNNYLV